MKRASLVLVAGLLTGYGSLALFLGAPAPTPLGASNRPKPGGQPSAEGRSDRACPRCAGPKATPMPEEVGAGVVGEEPGLSGNQARGLATLELDIRYRGRRVPLEIPIYLSGEDQSLDGLWRPTQRQFHTLPGRCFLDLGLEELREERSRELTLRAGAVTQLVVELSDELRIFGRVKKAEGDPFEGDFVIRRLGDRMPSPLELGSSPDQSCGDLPGFLFSGLEPGRYVIGFTADGHCAEVLTTVDLANDPLFLELERPPIARERILDVTVLNPSGGLCEDAKLRIWTWSGTEDRLALRRGSRLFFRCLEPGSPEGLSLRASHPDFGGARVDVPKAGGSVTLSLARPASLTLRLLGFETSGCEGVVEAFWFQREAIRWIKRPVDSTGAAVFEKLSPGPGSLMVYAGEEPLILRQFELASGSQTLELDCPKLASLEVSAPDFPGATVTLKGPRRNSRSLDLSGQGRGLMRNLPHGRWSLKLASQVRRAMVPGPPVVFRAGETRAWRVRIDDPEGPLARLGLRHGDRILALDGRPIDDATSFYARQARLALVLRAGGGREELPLPLDRLGREDFLLGGSLEPSHED